MKSHQTVWRDDSERRLLAIYRALPDSEKPYLTEIVYMLSELPDGSELFDKAISEGCSQPSEIALFMRRTC